MQTTCYIPATTSRPQPYQPGVGWLHAETNCTIIAFVGISGVEGNRETDGPWSMVVAIAIWEDGTLFERPLSEFRVRPEADLTPAEPGIEVLERVAEEAQAAVAAAQASNEKLRRQQR